MSKGSRPRPCDDEMHRRDEHSRIFGRGGIVILDDPISNEAKDPVALAKAADSVRAVTVTLAGGRQDGLTLSVSNAVDSIQIPFCETQAVYDPAPTVEPRKPIPFAMEVYERSTLDPTVYRYVSSRGDGDASHDSKDSGVCQDAAWIRKQIKDRDSRQYDRAEGNKKGTSGAI